MQHTTYSILYHTTLRHIPQGVDLKMSAALYHFGAAEMPWHIQSTYWNGGYCASLFAFSSFALSDAEPSNILEPNKCKQTFSISLFIYTKHVDGGFWASLGRGRTDT